MITESTYTNAYMAAKALDAKGINLVARPSTIMEELIDDCSPIAFAADERNSTTLQPNIYVTPGVKPSLSARTVKEAAREIADATNIEFEWAKHSAQVVTVADQVAPVVQNHISAIRNQVVPVISEYVEAFQKWYDFQRAVDPASEFEIEQPIFPAFLQDTTFNDLNLSKYPILTQKTETATLPTLAPIENIEEILSMLLVGSERHDTMVSAWFASIGRERVAAIFNDNFVSDHGEFRISDSYRMSSMNPYTIVEIATVCYLAAYSFQRNAPKLVASSTSESYDTSVQNYLDWLVPVLKNAVLRIEQMHEGAILVAEASTVKKKIVVNASVYKQWLNDGGCPEALLGMLVSNDFHYAASLATEKKDKLVSFWNSYVAATRHNRELDERRRFKDFVMNKISIDLNDPFEIEKERFAESPSERQSIVDRVEAELEHLSHNLLDDLEHTARHVVARGRFYYTSAYDFLNDMVEIEKKSPELPPAAAAGLATARYVTKYLLSFAVRT